MDNFWQGKTIIAYAALAHHTRFITPVMTALARQGAKIKYIVGQAERSQEMTALELGLPYAHIFDYVTEKDQEEIRANYSRLGKTFSQALKQDYLLGILPVTVSDKTLLAACQEYAGFKNLFDTERPDLCFALHEINRWGKCFAFWAKKYGVPFISLQEGLSYGLDFGYSGHAQYSTLNLVWGERVKKKLIGFEAPESKILAVGNTHLSMEMALQKERGIRKKKRRAYGIADKDRVALLILSVGLPVPELFFPVFKAVSETRGVTIFVKFHPACKKDQMDAWVEKVKQKHPGHSHFIHGEESTYDLISMADVVVLGQQSTTGLEALAFGKPLVKLDFAYDPKAPYSFVDQGVATKMRSEDLAEALKTGIDFSAQVDSGRVRDYLASELTDVAGAIEAVCAVFKKAVQGNQNRAIPWPPFSAPPDRKWTVVLQVPATLQALLAQIEALVVNSEGGGTYETLFLMPENLPHDIQGFLDTLEGDIRWVRPGRGERPVAALNQALTKARGQTIIFLEPGLAPLSGWLTHLEKGMEVHGCQSIFGARIADHQGKIAHAGLVVDQNHTPVSAYRHLDIHFAPALKERPFQMVDHFMAVDRDLFAALGGLTPEAGAYIIPDFCLKARSLLPAPQGSTIFLPDLQLIFTEPCLTKADPDHAVFFYSRWHGHLWESEQTLIREDKVSQEDLGQAALSSAMRGMG